jgi:hypothetical protein
VLKALGSFGLRWITSESEPMFTLVAPVVSSSTTATCCEGEIRLIVSQPASATANDATLIAKPSRPRTAIEHTFKTRPFSMPKLGYGTVNENRRPARGIGRRSKVRK